MANDQRASRVQFGANLRRLRKEAGLAQEKLARKADISTSAVVQLEAGRTSPRWDTMLALLDALEASPAELLHGLDQSEPAELTVNGRYPQTSNDLPFPSLNGVTHEPKRAVGA